MAHLRFNRNAGIICHFLPQPCQDIEETRLSGVGIAGKHDAQGLPAWPAL
jgi:hypothetical protein